MVEFQNAHMPTPVQRDMDWKFKLQSAGGAIEPGMIDYLQPTTLDTPISKMRESYEKNGYLWVKGVIPRKDVLQVRTDYFDYLQPTGLLKEGSQTVDGIFCGGDWKKWMGMGKLRRKLGYADINTEYLQQLVDAHSADWYLKFVAHPAIKEFIERLKGWDEALMLERSILRPNIPGGESTHVHYDQIFLRAAPPTSITCWIPMGDIAPDGGGLIYLQDSVPLGQDFERGFKAAAAHLSEAERISAYNETMMETGYLEADGGKFSRAWDKKWLVADSYEAGDIVLHSPYMIHSAGRNQDVGGVIRLATDLRFVEKGKPYDERWMNIYKPGDQVER